jgi:hypothetical protein
MQQILKDAELVSNLRSGIKDVEAGDYSIV